MTDELNDILDLKRPSPSPLVITAQNNQETAGTIIQKRSKTVVFVGILLLVIAFVLSIIVGGFIYDESIGIHSSVLSMAKKIDDSARENPSLMGQGYGNHEVSTYNEIESQKKQAPIKGLVAIASLIAGVILLRLKDYLCSECCSKVGATTAKLCGNCGTRFKRD